MNKSTLKYALEVLDKQRDAVTLGHLTRSEKASQDAYYRGMKNMLEIITTAGYTREGGYITLGGPFKCNHTVTL